MTVPSHGTSHVQPLLGAYVLGALTTQENRQVSRHLPGCDSCSAAYLQVAEAPSLLVMLSEADLLAAPQGPPDPVRPEPPREPDAS